MVDTISTHITLGGRLPRKLVPELCEVISHHSVSLDWDQELFQPTCEGDLLAACRSSGSPTSLFLCDHSAPWGEFVELQKFLVRHELHFDRYHESKYEISSELLCFRPELGTFRFLTDADERVIVPAENLLPAVELLGQVQRRLLRGEVHEAEALLGRCRAMLGEHLPPNFQDVPPLEIAAD